MAIWAELRRRNVFRVAAAYLIAAWFAMQGVSMAMGALELPEWFDGAVLVLLAVGFPLALVVAWAFESRDGQIVLTRGAAAPSAFRPFDAVLVAAIVALIGMSVFQITRPAAPDRIETAAAEAPAPSPVGAPAADGRQSIAVLPFADLSPEGDQEYFSDGLSEELLNALAQVEDLRVTARTSSFAFKGQNMDVRQIGQTLGVAHILEGSVRKAGDSLRITAQLIDVADGSHLWSDTYDRELTVTDVFAIQEEIAMAVADQLSVTLGVGARPADFGGTESFEAYDHYLRGRDLIARFESAAAMDAFRRATDIDPDYALAWTGIARAALQLSLTGDRTAERQTAALDAVQRAMRIEPDLWQAYSLHGLVLNQQLEWLQAQSAFDAAARLGATVTDDEWASTYASFLSDTGRMTEALAVMEAARAANPLSLQVSNATAWALHNIGRSEDAASERARSLGLEGLHDVWAYTHFNQILADGDADAIRAAVAGFPIATFGAGGTIDRWMQVWDQPEQAGAVLRADLADPDFLESMRNSPQLGAYASLAAYHGDVELALEILRVWVDVGGVSPVHLWHPLLAEVRRAEGFKEIVRSFGLVGLWRATGDWGDYCRPLGDDDFECR